MSFPKGFVWGAAASSYQIEGAAHEDGKGPSTWDMFCQKEGTIWNGQSGDVACDHYHRYTEDVGLMKQIGLNAYRLSISWPCVTPQRTSAINAKGLEFCDKLIDELLAAGLILKGTSYFSQILPILGGGVVWSVVIAPTLMRRRHK